MYTGGRPEIPPFLTSDNETLEIVRPGETRRLGAGIIRKFAQARPSGLLRMMCREHGDPTSLRLRDSVLHLFECAMYGIRRRRSQTDGSTGLPSRRQLRALPTRWASSSMMPKTRSEPFSLVCRAERASSLRCFSRGATKKRDSSARV